MRRSGKRSSPAGSSVRRQGGNAERFEAVPAECRKCRPQTSCSPARSDRFDGNRQQVLHQPDLFLQERFGVSNAAEHTVETRHGIHALANFIVSREQVLTRLLIAELRFVSHDGRKLPLKLVADIYYKRWPHVVVQRGIENLERPMPRRRLSFTCAEIGLAVR